MLIKILMVDKNEEWWLDSGATCHINPYKNAFKTYEVMNEEKIVYMDNSSTCAILGIGTMQLPLFFEKVLTLKEVYHIPGLRKSLVSIKKLDDHGFKIVVDS